MPRSITLFRTRPGLARACLGGRWDDAGRLPRYVLIFAVAAVALWAPILTYLKMSPPRYTSDVSLILPGSGAQASVNLADLGQASSSAASAFASSRISPTQTYKRLLAANRTIARAAANLGLPQTALGAPRIKLVDETSLIHFEMTGPTPAAAQARARAILTVFLAELDTLREDELRHRDRAARAAIAEYEAAVLDLRTRIATLQAESGLVSFDHYKDMVAQRDALADRLETARATRRAADATMLSLAAQLGLDAETAALNLRLHADPEFQELARTHAEQSARLAAAQGRFGKRHPQVTSAVHAVKGTEAKLAARGARIGGHALSRSATAFDLAPNPARAALMSDLVAAEAACAAAAETVAALARQHAAADREITALAPVAARLDDLSRDYQVAEAVFASALARTDTSKAEVYASYPLVQVLADAALPEAPTSPRRIIALAAGAAATVMVLMALGLAWLRQPLLNRLLTRDAP